MDSFDKGWFVLQTYSGYENKVKENLLQRAQTYNMLDNILRVEIPTQTVQVEKNGKKKEVEENRFPGYVLVEMVMTDEAWFVVRNTPNVTGFVGSHGNRSKPTPLLEQEIRDILVSMGQTVQEFDIDVEVGQTVRIIDGAFADYTGKITEIDNNKVKMIISMFGAQSPQKSISEQTAYEIDEEVRSLLNEARNKAAEIIQSNRETHKLIAEALLKYETLDSTQIKSLYETGKMPETVEEESHALSYDEVKSKMSEEK